MSERNDNAENSADNNADNNEVALADTAADAMAATAASKSKSKDVGELALDQTVTETASSGARPLDSKPAPRRLAHYELEEEIGRGGMGTVYRARDLALDRPVAVKVISSKFAGAEQRFYREARAQARINHPNVCHIYYVGEDRGQVFFAMELVEGQSLGELLAERGRLGAPEALDLIRQAALGLREAQRHNIIHRDVKPSNLMVDQHGVVKVMDFGIAKQAEAPADGAAASGPVEQTAIAGTPLYAAPEQLSGEAIDHRADIYALGATLHKLLTGSAPFKADSLEGITQMHKTETRPRFERRVVGQRDLSLLNELTDRMMAKSPADRFSSYNELLEGIEFAEPSTSRPAGFGIRLMAMLIDLIVVVVLVNLATLATSGADHPIVVLVVGFVYMVIGLGRFGSTIGRWLLGIEVTGPRKMRGIGFAAAATRCIWQLGFVLLSALLLRLGEQLALAPLELGASIALGTFIALNLVHVAFVSLRTASARTYWDNRANTQVRYLSVRGPRTGGETTSKLVA